MLLPPQLIRRLLWRRRVRASRVWQEAQRQEAAQPDAAIRRILGQARAIR